MKRFLPFILSVAAIVCCVTAGDTQNAGTDTRLGVWVTIFSPQKVHYSREGADRLIDDCVKCGINDIYLQVYRADKAYYDSSLTDRSEYEKMLSSSGTDMIRYIIEKASEKRISVHAWINLLSLAQNQNANIIRKFGEDVLTRDQHGRLSMPLGKKDDLDKYYTREDQLFLEPGDYRVRQYLSDIACEIVDKYPGLSGLHLDYIRYPFTVPFIPGSRFSSHGISYGYARMDLESFTKSTGLDAMKMERSRDNFTLWDDWRRERVTTLVKYISGAARKISPSLIISCTIVPSLERTYYATFQDWTEWLDKGYVDRVVTMNYTDDAKLARLRSRSIAGSYDRKKLMIGLGAYMLREKPGILEREILDSKDLATGGIVFFSYDEIAQDSSLRDFIAATFGQK